MNLPRRIRAHIQPPLLVKSQADRAEARPRAGRGVLILHHGNLRLSARRSFDRLPVLEVNAHDAVAIGDLAVPTP